MQPPSNVTCPVCGRPNRTQDQCTFCGASLQDVSPPRQEAPVPEPHPSSAVPAPDGAGGTGQPPFSSGPTAPWDGTALTPKFAGFWIRTVAYVIDGFLILVLLAILAGVGIFGYTSGSATDTVSSFSHTFYESNWNFLNVAVFALNMAYFTFFLGTRGQTPGKMICGLKVVRLDGSPVSFGQAAVRTLGYYLNHFTLCIGFLWVAIDPRKQGLHDKIAGTYEIRVGLAEIQDWQPPPSYRPGPNT
jgi:uncharacterized RDD family membrane protein YckC